MDKEHLRKRIQKAVFFFRTFKEKKDKDLYVRWFMDFVDLVEKYIEIDREENINGEKIEKSSERPATFEEAVKIFNS